MCQGGLQGCSSCMRSKTPRGCPGGRRPLVGTRTCCLARSCSMGASNTSPIERRPSACTPPCAPSSVPRCTRCRLPVVGSPRKSICGWAQLHYIGHPWRCSLASRMAAAADGPRGELPRYGTASPVVGGLQSTHAQNGGHAPGCRKGQAPRRAARVNQAMHRRAAPDAARTAALTGGHAYEVEKGWSRATAPQHRPPPQAPQSPRRSQRPPPAPRPPQRCTLCRATAGLRRPAAARAALGARPACRPARPR